MEQNVPNSNITHSSFDGDDATWAIAATQRASQAPTVQQPQQTSQPAAANASTAAGFVPPAPKTLRDAGLSDSQVEALVLRFVLNSGVASGREIATQVAIPFGITERLLKVMKTEQLLSYRSEAPLGDYRYELTPHGHERARRYAELSTYFGASPVPLAIYKQSVALQTVRHQKPTVDGVREAFSEMVLSDDKLNEVGEAMNLGLGMFLHGEPGNGKTMLAERVVKAYSDYIWIPRAISAGGEIIRLYDPIHHEAVSIESVFPKLQSDEYDHRWVLVRRPTIIVGGELLLDNLEVKTNPITRISEAPIQMKANGGSLVFDDFGRNVFEPDQLLNRLIVPLEKRYDILNLPSGRTFQTPFDTLVVFSTNLDPADLADEAFLRRIPYKIEIVDPTEEQFRNVFGQTAAAFGLTYTPEIVDYLIDEHYTQKQRCLRFCHPRDLLRHVRNGCDFRSAKPEVTKENLDSAVKTFLALQAS